MRLKPPALRAVFGRSTPLLVALTFAAPAYPAVDLALRFETSIGTNSNPFLTPDAGTPGPTPDALPRMPQSSGMRVTTVETGASIPLASNDTRLILSTQLSEWRYGTLPDINNTHSDVAVRLPWRYGRVWEGSVGVSRQRFPYAFEDGTYTQLDMVERTSRDAQLVLKASPSVEVQLSLQNQGTKYQDLSRHGVLAQDIHRTRIGARYRMPNGNSVELGQQSARSTFGDRTADQVAVLDNGYTDHETYLEALWDYSVKTHVAARLSSVQRSQKTLGIRNTTMSSAQLRIAHVMSPQTRLDFEFRQEPVDTNETNTLFATSRVLRAGLTWKPSPKTRLGLVMQHEVKSDHLAPGADPFSFTQDTGTRMGVRLQHEITRGVTFFVDAARLKQHLGGISSPLGQTVVRIGLDYSYENMTGARARTGQNSEP